MSASALHCVAQPAHQGHEDLELRDAGVQVERVHEEGDEGDDQRPVLPEVRARSAAV